MGSTGTLRPEAPTTADLALWPETEEARAEETDLALRAAERGGDEEKERARQAAARTGDVLALRAASCWTRGLYHVHPASTCTGARL